jgi:hypothetical protein
MALQALCLQLLQFGYIGAETLKVSFDGEQFFACVGDFVQKALQSLFNLGKGWLFGLSHGTEVYRLGTCLVSSLAHTVR